MDILFFKKSEIYGIRGNGLDLIKSYLTNRTKIKHWYKTKW